MSKSIDSSIICYSVERSEGYYVVNEYPFENETEYLKVINDINNNEGLYLGYIFMIYKNKVQAHTVADNLNRKEWINE